MRNITKLAVSTQAALLTTEAARNNLVASACIRRSVVPWTWVYVLFRR